MIEGEFGSRVSPSIHYRCMSVFLWSLSISPWWCQERNNILCRLWAWPDNFSLSVLLLLRAAQRNVPFETCVDGLCVAVDAFHGEHCFQVVSDERRGLIKTAYCITHFQMQSLLEICISKCIHTCYIPRDRSSVHIKVIPFKPSIDKIKRSSALIFFDVYYKIKLLIDMCTRYKVNVR